MKRSNICNKFILHFSKFVHGIHNFLLLDNLNNAYIFWWKIIQHLFFSSFSVWKRASKKTCCNVSEYTRLKRFLPRSIDRSSRASSARNRNRAKIARTRVRFTDRSYLSCGFVRGLFKYKLQAHAAYLADYPFDDLEDVRFGDRKEIEIYRPVIIIAKGRSVIDDFVRTRDWKSSLFAPFLCPPPPPLDNDHYAIVMAWDCRLDARSTCVNPPHPVLWIVSTGAVRPLSMYQFLGRNTTDRRNNLLGYVDRYRSSMLRCHCAKDFVVCIDLYLNYMLFCKIELIIIGNFLEYSTAGKNRCFWRFLTFVRNRSLVIFSRQMIV